MSEYTFIAFHDSISNILLAIFTEIIPRNFWTSESITLIQIEKVKKQHLHSTTVLGYRYSESWMLNSCLRYYSTPTILTEAKYLRLQIDMVLPHVHWTTPWKTACDQWDSSWESNALTCPTPSALSSLPAESIQACILNNRSEHLQNRLQETPLTESPNPIIAISLGNLACQQSCNKNK